MLTKHTFPNTYTEMIERSLNKLERSLNKPRALASDIRKLSDFYISSPGQPTPYEKAWAVSASICYYFPLNYLRTLDVIQQSEDIGFWENNSSWIEVGSGLSPFANALLDTFPKTKFRFCFVERSPIIKDIHQRWISQRPNHESYIWHDKIPDNFSEYDGTCLSYALTEMSRWPTQDFRTKALCFIEPSTHQAGRRLQELRQELLDNTDYKMWAPCPHNQTCPLLVDSGKDWCHHRFRPILPSWFSAIEEHLPIRNHTLTYSYLCAQKLSPFINLKNADTAHSVTDEEGCQEHFDLARIIGDLRVEKGKSKQMMCRGPRREFLAFLKRYKIKHPPLRGSLVWLDRKNCENKANECRPLKEGAIEPIQKGQSSTQLDDF